MLAKFKETAAEITPDELAALDRMSVAIREHLTSRGITIETEREAVLAANVLAVFHGLQLNGTPPNLAILALLQWVSGASESLGYDLPDWPIPPEDS